MLRQQYKKVSHPAKLVQGVSGVLKKTKHVKKSVSHPANPVHREKAEGAMRVDENDGRMWTQVLHTLQSRACRYPEKCGMFAKLWSVLH